MRFPIFHSSSFTLHSSFRRGFTLIEIMVVVILIAIVTATIVPNLGGSAGGRQLDATAEQFENLFDYCYNASLSARRVYGVIFAPDHQAFDVVSFRIERNPDDPEAQEEAFVESVKVPGLTEKKLPEGVRLAEVIAFDETLIHGPEEDIRILFFPDGSTEFATLIFEDESGDQRGLDLNGLSGSVRVFNPQIGEASEGPRLIEFAPEMFEE